MRASTWIAGAAAAIYLLTGCVCYAEAAPGARPVPTMVGVNHAQAHHAAGIQDARQMGARYDRIDFTPRTQGGLDTSDVDAKFTEEAGNGMRLLPLLVNYVPFTQTNISKFVSFAQAFMERYGAGGSFWSENPNLDPTLAPTIFEVENEVYGWWFYSDAPNNAAGYDDLFKQVVTAGRQINPAYRFLFSAAARTYTAGGQYVGNWADLVTAADPTIGDYIDGLVVHPYGVRDANNSTGYGVTRTIHDAFAAHGISRPVYITEVGLCTSPVGYPSDRCGTEMDQQNAINFWFSDFRATPWIYSLVIYQYRDPSSTNLADSEYWYGLVNGFGMHKAGWSTYQAQAAQTT
jgi:hypothetical protein